MADTQVTYLSWLRRGLAAGIDVIDSGTVIATSAKVHLTLQFAKQKRAIPSLTLFGPGDIAGLDPRAVVRAFPAPNVTDAEAAFFASLDFDQADLPWRYTPARFTGDQSTTPGQSTDTLRPWFTLIVLDEEKEIVEVRPASATQRLPILKVAVANLPDLSVAWAWAHVQTIAADSGGSPDDIKQPGNVVARLLSPRLLKKQRPYSAFLVPTFERGRRVGIGEKLDDRTKNDDGSPSTNVPVGALEPAWTKSPPDANVELPIYYQWRFHTGAIASFAELVARLAPTDTLPDTIGRREMDVTAPGLDVGQPVVTVPRKTIAVGGALRSDAAAAEDVADEDPTNPDTKPLQDDIDAWTAALGNFMRQAQALLNGRNEKIVVPPLYGRWYAGQANLDSPSGPNTNPSWFYKLNRHPRFRIAAALGTKVVQREQQALMTSAWQQIDHLTEINSEKKRLQVARLAGARTLFRYLDRGGIQSRLSVTSFVHGQLASASGSGTVFADITSSPLRVGVLDPQWRRLSSAQGRIGKRLGLRSIPIGKPSQIFEELNARQLQVAPPPQTRPDTFTIGSTLKPLLPAGGLPGSQVDALATILGTDRLTFWGLVLVWCARHLLLTLNGQFWWLTNRLLRTGLDLIRVASGAGHTAEQLAQKLQSDSFTPGDVTNSPRTPTFATLETLPDLANIATLPLPDPPGSAPDSVEAGLFKSAFLALTTYRRGPFIDLPALTKINLPAVSANVMAKLQPNVTLQNLAQQRHRILLTGFPWANPDQLEEIQAAPEFPQPMCLPLQAISDEWILPGISQLAPNAVAALRPSQPFIEAYLVGLNHEMTRELLWNHYPIDQRGTYFRQFWDSRGFVKGSADPVADRGPDGLKDIKPVRLWSTNALGQNSSRVPASEQLVLVVRGDLVRQYPNFTASAAVAKNVIGVVTKRVPDDTQQLFPVFQGRVGSDVAYFGFDLDRAVARGNPGWFFILQEHPAAVRFGLKTDDADQRVLVTPGDFGNAATAAQVAVKAVQPPVRVAIHASEIIPATP